MNGRDTGQTDVGVKSYCVKKFMSEEDAAGDRPFEIVSGGDELPSTITVLDSQGSPRVQIVTYEPEELR